MKFQHWAFIGLVGANSWLNAGGAESKSVTFFNYGDGYAYTIFLNHEPVLCGNGLSAIPWQNFPLQSGPNDLTIRVQCRDSARVRVHLKVVEGEEILAPAAEWKAYLRGGEMETNLTFQMTEAVPKQAAFSVLKLSESDSNKIIGASLEIVNAFAKGDVKALAAIVDSAPDQIAAGYPKWFLKRTKPVSITHVATTNDLQIIVGERLAMVLPSYHYFQEHSSSELVSVVNEGQDATVSKSSLNFCRVDGHLALLEPNGVYRQIHN